MAVTNVCEAAAAATGKIGRDTRTYAAPYVVTVDDPTDGPALIAFWFETNGYALGVPYSYAGDLDTRSFLDGISPQRMANNLYEWLVTLTYSPIEPQTEQPDDAGNPSGDPLEWQEDHIMGFASYSEPCWTATNITPFPHPLQLLSPFALDFIRSANTLGMVVNSAGIPYDPTLMREVYARVWQATTRTTDFVDNDVYIGAINSAPVQYATYLISDYNFTQKTYPKWSLKCTAAGATYRFANETKFWEWNYEFRVAPFNNFINGEPDPAWLEVVLDRGLTKRAAPGSTDGKGGTIPPRDNQGTGPEFPPDAAPATAVVDANGNRVPEMVPFNGMGHPLREDDIYGDIGYFFAWRKDEEIDFTGLPFFQAGP